MTLRRILHHWRIALLAVAFAALPATAADPTAFVSDMKGDVTLNDGGRPPFLGELIPGSRLKVAAGAQAAVMFVVSGEEFALKGPGEYVIGKDAVTAVSGAAPVRRKLATRADSAVIVQASKSGSASLRMRSAPAPKMESSGPRIPVGKTAQLQPTLRWSGDPAITYEIVLMAASGKQVHAGPAKGNAFKVPSKLVPGQSYTWSVAAPGATPADARFEVLAADAVAAADKARASAKLFGDRVQLALLLQELGATTDAKEVWAQLAAERPDLPELAGLARP